ncbi:MAG: sigma-70 family RNA polymerase sigma factor [Myxococcota bacterium]
MSLESRLSEARAAHPWVALSDARFLEHLERHLAPLPEAERAPALEAVHAADLLLALAAAAQEVAALRLLQREYFSKIPGLLERARFSSDLAEEATQALSEKLLVAPPGGEAKLMTYTGRGPLLAWLRVSATRTALNLRRNKADKSSALPPEELWVADSVMPELAFIRQMHREQFQQAFLMAFAELTDRQRTLLKLAFVDSLTLDKIGLIYGSHKSTVSRWLTEAKDSLDASTRGHLKSSLDISDGTCEDLVVLLRSHLDLSLRSLFRTQ